MQRIFKWFTKESECKDFKAYGYWFIQSFDRTLFSGLDEVLYCILSDSIDVGAEMSQKFLEVWLKTSGKRVVKEYNIKLEATLSYDYTQASQFEEAYASIVEAVQLAYSVILEQDLNGKDFITVMYEYLSTESAEAYQRALAEAFPRITDGSDPNEVAEKLQYKLELISETYSKDKLEDLETDIKRLAQPQRVHTLCPTGIPVLDADCGGVKTTKIFTLNAQPAGGKTRFALIQFAYQVMTVAHKDVLCYELELPKVATENILIAHHIYHMFRGTIKLPDSLLEQVDSLSPEQRGAYEVAKADLFNSGKYGKFIVKEECSVQRLNKEVKGFAQTHPNFGLLIIDYMAMIESTPIDDGKYHKSLEEYEIITEAYKTVKRLLLRYDFTAVCINQYNDKGIDAAYQGKTIRSGYIQGGHIVNRHTDYDINLTFTEEQKMRNVRTLSLGKTRFTGGFPPTLLSVDLAISLFQQGG